MNNGRNIIKTIAKLSSTIINLVEHLTGQFSDQKTAPDEAKIVK